MKELNVERKRYLILNLKERALNILRSGSQRIKDFDFKFQSITNIERSL